MSPKMLLKPFQLFQITITLIAPLPWPAAMNPARPPSQERKRSITPPWGMLGLGDSQWDMSFNSSNYLIHHALGILAQHLVRKGMLVAANNGGETAGEMEGQTSDTQDPAVDAKSE